VTTVRKHSRKRDAILEKIRQTTSHPSAVWIFEELRKDIRTSASAPFTGICPCSGTRDWRLGRHRGRAGAVRREYGRAHPFICLDCGTSSTSRPRSTRHLRSSVERGYGLDV
jgi:Fur family peroxide stress response transcriptional regulator